jgi:molecular chaperone DnaK (HSP70)
MKPIYGIDLGTTYTKCAVVRPTDSVLEVFKLDKASRDAPQNTLTILRSAVTVGCLDGRNLAYVGTRSLEELQDWDADDGPPLRRFEESKMYIGEDADHAQGHDSPPWPFPPHDWAYRPEDIGAIVLRKVKKEVEAARGPAMERVVITHPQYFSDTRRQATRQAAEIAGLEVVDMLTEPDAAALAFNATAAPGTYMVFDMGGGTLDVTICRIEPSRVVVLSSDGTKQAGRDFDRVIFDRMVDDYRTAFPAFEPAKLDARTLQVWMKEAERVKRMLNDQEVVATKYQCDNSLFSAGAKRIVIKRDELYAASAPIVEASIACATAALDQAKLRWRDLTNVLCVGGSTRLKHLHAALERAAGRTIDINELEVDSAIARGAATHGHQLATRGATITGSLSGPIPRLSEGGAPTAPTAPTAPIELIGVLARGLGVKIYDPRRLRDVIYRLVPKGTQIPWRKTFPKPFRTKDARQTSIVVELFEGESEDPDECELLGTLELTGFPPPASAGQAVEVTIDIEQNGTKHLIVSALAHRQEAVIAFDPRRVIGALDIEHRRDFIAKLQIC